MFRVKFVLSRFGHHQHQHSRALCCKSNSGEKGKPAYSLYYPVTHRVERHGNRGRNTFETPQSKVLNAALRREKSVCGESWSACSCSRLVISVCFVPVTAPVNGNGGFPRWCSRANHATMGCREGEGEGKDEKGIDGGSSRRGPPLIAFS